MGGAAVKSVVSGAAVKSVLGGSVVGDGTSDIENMKNFEILEF